MNKVILMGRLTRDPEVRYSAKGADSMAIARYSLAVNRKFKREGEAEADFLNIVAFSKDGEFAEKYFKKGMQVCVVGRMQTGSYEKDGVKHYTTDVVVEDQYFADSKRDDSKPSTPTAQSQSKPTSSSNTSIGGFVPVDDDDDLPY